MPGDRKNSLHRSKIVVCSLQQVGRLPAFFIIPALVAGGGPDPATSAGIMDVIQKITQTIEPSLDSLGYALVLVKLGDGGKRKTLTVMAERKDDVNMSFDDCTEISRTVSALLDVEDPITTAYNLEVCSPGIDRPLTKLADYTRFKGLEVKLETIFPVDGRKRFRGVIKGVDKETVQLAMPEGEVQIVFAHIRTCRLVMTDALVEAHVKKEKKAN